MLTDPQLKSKVDALWDRFWSGGIANPITAIEPRAAVGGTVMRASLEVSNLSARQISFIS